MRALEVLESNWLGHGTRPSRLYPHQWSWDSACIAMGYAGWNQPRAEMELRSLFAGQWANGLLPHIVFAEGDGRYFPGPDFWQAERSPDAPRTSGPRGSRSRRSMPPRRYACSGGCRTATAAIAFLARARAEAPRLARVPLPRANAGRRRAGRDLAPVGVGDGQLPALGRGPRADPADRRAGSRVPARGRRAREPGGATDRRGVRPLRLPRRALPRSRRIAPTGSRTRRRSPFSPCCSTRCWCRRISTWPRSRRCSARIPASTRQWAELTAGRPPDGAVERAGGALRRLRPRGREARRGANGRGPGASVRRCADRRAGAPDGRATCGLARRGQLLGLGGDEPRTRRSRLRADAVLARPDLADSQLGPATGSRPVRLHDARGRRSDAP